MTRALVTGVTGQDGSYLLEQLLGDGVSVSVLLRPEDVAQSDVYTKQGVETIIGDLADFDSLRLQITSPGFDEVYHLAGVSSVAESWKSPINAGVITGIGAVAIMSAAFDANQDCRFVLASSAEVFAASGADVISEATPIAPTNPYGAAKAYAHLMARLQRDQGRHASAAILFNHESPRRGADFLTRKITLAAARIALGLQERVTLGNLDVKRDWGFAPDYVRALQLIARHDSPGEYVIATGVLHTIADVLDVAFDQAGLGKWTPYVFQDPILMRPNDAPVLTGDPSRAKRVLGWEPTVSFEQMIRMMVVHDLAMLERDRDTPK